LSSLIMQNLVTCSSTVYTSVGGPKDLGDAGTPLWWGMCDL